MSLPVKNGTGTVAALVLALVVSCASGDATSESESPGVARVEVVNSIQPPTWVTIYLDPQIGGRTLLGTVDPSSRGTLRVRSLRVSATYRLEARTGGGSSLVSDSFTLNAGDTIVWDLRRNVVAP